VIKAEGPGAIRALDERIHTEKQLSWTGNIPAGGLAFDMFFICYDVLGLHTQATFSLGQPAVKLHRHLHMDQFNIVYAPCATFSGHQKEIL